MFTLIAAESRYKRKKNISAEVSGCIFADVKDKGERGRRMRGRQGERRREGRKKGGREGGRGEGREGEKVGG